MIEKLYNLKKLQTDQKILQRQQFLTKISDIDEEVIQTKRQIDTTGVDKYGAISDFAILQIHKNTMKLHISKLTNERDLLLKKIEKLNNDIVELQKESEQFDFIRQEIKKEEYYQMLKDEEVASTEYMQSQWISQMR